MKNNNSIFQKAILIIIASALICLVVQNQIIIQRLNYSKNQNQNQNPFVNQVSNKDGRNFIIMPIKEDGSIDVNIKKINETIDVNIEELNGKSFYYSDGLPVKIVK